MGWREFIGIETEQEEKERETEERIDRIGREDVNIIKEEWGIEAKEVIKKLEEFREKQNLDTPLSELASSFANDILEDKHKKEDIYRNEHLRETARLHAQKEFGHHRHRRR